MLLNFGGFNLAVFGILETHLHNRFSSHVGGGSIQMLITLLDSSKVEGAPCLCDGASAAKLIEVGLVLTSSSPPSTPLPPPSLSSSSAFSTKAGSGGEGVGGGPNTKESLLGIDFEESRWDRDRKLGASLTSSATAGAAAGLGLLAECPSLRTSGTTFPGITQRQLLLFLPQVPLLCRGLLFLRGLRAESQPVMEIAHEPGLQGNNPRSHRGAWERQASGGVVQLCPPVPGRLMWAQPWQDGLESEVWDDRG